MVQDGSNHLLGPWPLESPKSLSFFFWHCWHNLDRSFDMNGPEKMYCTPSNNLGITRDLNPKTKGKPTLYIYIYMQVFGHSRYIHTKKRSRTFPVSSNGRHFQNHISSTIALPLRKTSFFFSWTRKCKKMAPPQNYHKQLVRKIIILIITMSCSNSAFWSSRFQLDVKGINDGGMVCPKRHATHIPLSKQV